MPRAALLRMQEDQAGDEEFDIDAAVDDVAKGEKPAAADGDDDDDDLLSSPAFLKQKLKVLEKEKEDVAAQIEAARADAAEVELQACAEASFQRSFAFFFRASRSDLRATEDVRLPR